LSVSRVSALILAGGKATRMGGVAKHELVVDGETIFARQVKVLAPRVSEILVSSPSDIAGYRTVRDAVPDVGPLAGIAAGLAACTTEWMLVVAGDMPYLTGELIERMLAEVTGDGAIDAVGILSNGLPEPLACVLNRRMLSLVEKRIADRIYRASGLLRTEGLHVRWITDADPGAFRNVNSPEDL
jgi:molybdopterin-guanine dinucleotide biosynthesis protein A